MKSFTKITLTLFFFFAYLFDLVTFLVYNHHEFEVNPIYLLTGSIWPLLIIKTIGVLGICYIFNFVKFKQEWLKHFLTLALVLGFIIQFLGGITNVNIHEKVTNNEININDNVMPKQKAYSAYSAYTFLFFFYPLSVSVISFGLYRKIWC